MIVRLSERLIPVNPCLQFSQYNKLIYVNVVISLCFWSVDTACVVLSIQYKMIHLTRWSHLLTSLVILVFTFVFFFFPFNNNGSVLRYQPDGSHTSGKAERNVLSPEESELTESESHFNMLKGGSSTLQTALHPPALPSEQSSSVVNMSISVLGKKTASHGEHLHFLTDFKL